MVVYSNYIYIYGGETATDQYLTDFYTFDLYGNNIKAKILTVISPTRYFSYTIIGDFIYIYGGQDVNGVTTNKLYKIQCSRASNEVITSNDATSLPALYNSSMNSFNNKLYIFGGRNNDGSRNHNLHIVTFTNDNTYSFTTETYDNITIRSLAKMIMYNNDIYIYGGFLTGYGWGNDIHKLENNNYKHYKNITELPSINNSINTSYNSNIFIYDNDKLSRITVNNTTNYTYTYTNYGKIIGISNRTLAGITAFESNLYIFGGQDDDNTYLNDIHKISFDDNNYRYIESSNLESITPRSQFGIETDGNYIYIYGGKVDNTNYLNNLCKIKIDDYSIVYNNQIAEIDRCINSSIIILDDYLLIYGGETEADQFNNNLHRLNKITYNYKDTIVATPYFNNTNKIIGNGNIVYILWGYSDVSSITSISFSSKDYYIKTVSIEEYYFDKVYLSYINDKLYIYTYNFSHNGVLITNINIFVIDLTVFNNYILPGNFNTKFNCQDITIRSEQTEWSINTTANMNFYKDSVLIAYLDDNTQNVNLNFTGQHITLLKDTKDYNGYIVCADGSYYNRSTSNYSKFNSKQNINIIESLPNVILSNKIKDPAVFGVISNKYQDFNMTLLKTSKIENKSYESAINSIGEGAIWVSSYNGNLNNGDYITSSVIPGIGMKQDDDLLHNYTVAKITMNCDFNPNYIPLQKMKTDGSSNILFNENNDIIYEYEYDVNSNIKYDYEYDLKYIRLNGDIIDKTTYDLELSKNMKVYKIAFVGCTYHCG